jgi:periplasmic divalent cation tolerance protein
MVFIYTTFQNADEARNVAKKILAEKSGGWVDMWPIKSFYVWQGEAREESGEALLITTTEARLQEIENLISQNHGHRASAIAAIGIQRINRPYKEHIAQHMGG